ncbi:unnamed protein product [Thelazia callipaeda]|uniref:C2H2-type domain-containing protein n=1 Tax=Thelazia callipaeda TaxID=103827 RepID=A0A0N5CLD2_THECL|nr:unnamed protein product [Thelazia callipaeda]
MGVWRELLRSLVITFRMESGANNSDDDCPVLISEKESTNLIECEENSASVSPCQLSSSSGNDRGQGKNPLQKFSLLIGSRKLTFRFTNMADIITSDGLFNEENEIEAEDCSSNTLIRNDLEIDDDKKPMYNCEKCGRSYTDRTTLIIHKKTHSVGKPYQCPICTKRFVRQVNYNVHMKLHASGRRYFCSLCGKWFRTQSLMSEHEVKYVNKSV